MIQTSRRSFLIGTTTLVTAPAIIRVENLMPVKLMVPEPETVWHIGIRPACIASLGCAARLRNL